MAVVYITEHSIPTLIHGGLNPVAKMPALAEQTVAIGGASVQSNAFSSNTRMIGVHTDAICSILIGSNPTATASKRRLAANTTEYFEVTPGDKIAVITNT